MTKIQGFSTITFALTYITPMWANLKDVSKVYIQTYTNSVLAICVRPQNELTSQSHE